VNGDRYLNMLQSQLWLQIATRDDIHTMFFQQDGAPAHFARNVCNWLDETFDGR
jgi:hypothetical protein